MSAQALSAISTDMLMFPQTNKPVYSSDSWGSLKPGTTNVGFTAQTSTKKRLGDTLVEVAEIAKDAFGRIVARKEANADRKARNKILRDNETYDAINIAGYTTNRQSLILMAVIGLGILLIFMSARR